MSFVIRKSIRRFRSSGPGLLDIQPVRLAVLGDSLSLGFHLSSLLTALWRARVSLRKNWVVDDQGILDSVFERLSRRLPVVLDHFASVCAQVDPPGTSAPPFPLVGTRHLSEQIDQILKLDAFPEIVLLWIGHNNLDWVTPGNEFRVLEPLPLRAAEEFLAGYHFQLGRLVRAAAVQAHPVRIVVFALGDFEKFFQAREETEAIKLREPERYPYLERDYRVFHALAPEHRSRLTALGTLFNARLEFALERWEPEFQFPPHLRMRFSKALWRADLSRAEMLSDADAWHPSPLGHRTLAAAAFPVVESVVNEVLQQRGEVY